MPDTNKRLTTQFNAVIPSLLIYLFCAATVFSQQLPFSGSPAAIPGQIEAEDFDLGDEGVAYHDTDVANNGSQYRDTGVDIEVCGEGGFNVGWIDMDEWLEYTVNISTSGTYIFEIRVAAQSDGGNFHIEFDGIDVTGSAHFNATGGWQSWSTVTIADVVLAEGEQVMRFVAESPSFNVNYINVKRPPIPNPPVVTLIAPEDNAEFSYGENIAMAATAYDSNGTVVKVEFYADGNKIGQDTSEPYEMLWQPPNPGKYDLYALAIDNDGAQGISEKVDINVRFPQFDNTLTFSHERGFYTNPFTLTISSSLADAAIKYTLDGSNPLTSETALMFAAPVNMAINPNSTAGRGLTPGVVVRAVGIKDKIQQTGILTHTYLFVDEVKDQGHPGGDWPDSGVNGQTWRYDMDQGVVNDSRYKNIIDDALLDIPTISFVTDLDNLFDSGSGIYVNAQYHGIEWERPTSVELINPDGTAGFQIDAGLRIRGGWSRHGNYPKHAFRLFFREEYGQDKLQFPLFGDEGVDEFEKMDLRCAQNYAWSNGAVYETTMNRDVFSRDVQGEMGRPYTRSRYYHLYIDGAYWGLYQTQERPEANFGESYLGGSNNDYDVVKVDVGENWNLYQIEATDGNLDAWREVWNATQTGFAANLDYFKLEGKAPDGTIDPAGKKLIDIDNLIDYMIIIFYTGNFDAPVSKFRGDFDPNNFYALYNRYANDGFVFLAHDSEHTLFVQGVWPGIGIDEDRVNINANVYSSDKFQPQYLHRRLAENAEYRMRFADHAYRHLFNKGVLTPDRAIDLFIKRAEEIELAIVAESARWGDFERSKHNAWQPAIAEIVEEFFPVRGEVVIQQLKLASLYPNLEPPVFKANGQEIIETHLQITTGINLELANPNGTSGSIKYTLDGTDPRNIGGAVSTSAFDAGDNQTLTINTTTKLMARIRNGTSWSALHEITFSGNEDLNPLQLTEIHYHPLDEGENDGKLYEFIELQNTGSTNLNWSLVSFTAGIDYSFPSGTTLAAGGFLVLASNASFFQQRYGFAPFGQFSGQLDNAGERLVMVNADGDTLVSVRYNDKAPWPVTADGQGPSLAWTNKSGSRDPNDPINWTASHDMHGSPGAKDLATSVAGQTQTVPANFSLQQNYPNPFNPGTTIEFDVQSSGHVKLFVYDLLGRVVTKLIDKEMSAGHYSMHWDAGKQPAGVYFYRIVAGRFTSTRKMLLLK